MKHFNILFACFILIGNYSAICKQLDTKIVYPVKAVKGDDGVYKIPVSPNTQKHRADVARKEAEKAKEKYEQRLNDSKLTTANDNTLKIVINWDILNLYYLCAVTLLFIFILIKGRKK